MYNPGFTMLSMTSRKTLLGFT